MSTPGPKPKPTLLKLIRGDKNTDRFKDDRPKVDDLPRIPPGTVLSDAEASMWEWLMANVVIPGIHGTSDGAAFVKIARLWARANAADAKIVEHGLVMKNPAGGVSLQPYTRLSRDTWRELGAALADIGATPSGRVRLAGPRKGGGIPDATSWDQID